MTRVKLPADFPWMIPRSTGGYLVVKKGGRWDPAFYQAAQELANRESARKIRKVSVETIIMTHALKSNISSRSWLNKRTGEIKRQMKKQLKRGKQHEITTIHEGTDTPTN